MAEEQTLGKIYKIANNYKLRLPGENVKTLFDLAMVVFDDVEKVVKYFNTPYKILKDKTPYELCKEGKAEYLEVKLMDIITAAQGR